MSTYLFYDIESTGLSRCFDQMIQFAAIRCDTAFNILERHQYLVKLNCDVIPHPEAILTHEIGIHHLQAGLSELEAIQTIHQLFNQPGTRSVGYNTLNFDDELLRFTFYRNLLPPYTHQYANQCSRLDIYPMTLFYYLFKPDRLNWPQRDGKPSLKLEAINEANQFVEGRSHDAMVDVLATMALAKQLATDQRMWDYLCQGFNKTIDEQRLVKLPIAFEAYRTGLLVVGNLGTALNYQAPVLSLGRHQHYTNQTLWLRLDLPELRQATPETFKDNCYVLHKKLGEPPFVLPLTARFTKHLSPERQKQVEDNIAFLQMNHALLEAIHQHYQTTTYAVLDTVDIDAALYQSGFFTRDETVQAHYFHHAQPNEKQQTILAMRSERLIALATRIVGRHFPDQLTPEQQASFKRYLEKIYSSTPPIDFKGFPRYSLQNALHDIAHCRKSATLSADKQQLLDELETYLQAVGERYGAPRATE